MKLTKKQFRAFTSDVRLCALFAKLNDAIEVQTEAIYGDDVYADVAVVLWACAVADQFRNTIGEKAEVKPAPVTDGDTLTLDQKDKFKSDRKLKQLSDKVFLIVSEIYQSNQLYTDLPKSVLDAAEACCNVADRFRVITKNKVY